MTNLNYSLVFVILSVSEESFNLKSENYGFGLFIFL